MDPPRNNQFITNSNTDKKVKQSDLENAISLSQVDISGDDSEITLFSSWNWSGKADLQKFCCLTFIADKGEWFSRRIFPSDKDLLKIDLNNIWQSKDKPELQI